MASERAFRQCGEAARRSRVALSSAVLAAWMILPAAPAGAAGVAPLVIAQAPEKRTCSLNIAARPPFVRVAALGVALPWGRLRVTYRGHSSFLIETPGGASVFTDYNGVHAPLYVPDIVTMNNSHTSHYTDHVDSKVRHVLRGWDPAGGVADHDVQWKDLRVFNVPTNLVEFSGRRMNGNSIFVIQAAGLCLAHLGHLHHALNPEHVERMGRIDILFVPIDGGLTMSHDEAFHVIDRVSPRLVIPMHFQFPGSAEAFIARAERLYKVAAHDGATLEVGRGTLPAGTEVLFLRPY